MPLESRSAYITPYHIIYFFNLVQVLKEIDLIGFHEALVDVHPATHTHTWNIFSLLSNAGLAPVTLFASSSFPVSFTPFFILCYWRLAPQHPSQTLP